MSVVIQNTFPTSLLLSVWYSGLCLVFLFFFYLIGYWCEREAETSQKILVISPWQHLQWWKDVCRQRQWERVLEWECQEQVWWCCCPWLTLSLSPQTFPVSWPLSLSPFLLQSDPSSPKRGCCHYSFCFRRWENWNVTLKCCPSFVWGVSFRGRSRV